MTFRIDSRRARVHALLVATVLWLAAAVTGFSGPGYRSMAGPLKGGDFVHLYTIGSVARTSPQDLYSYDVTHRVQGELVPESASLIYPPLYPPQTALLFAPFSTLSYGQALLLWTAFSLVAYVGIVRLAWGAVRGVLPDWQLVAAAAAAFPPFWQCVMHGQTTVLVLLAFGGGWWALERRRHVLAGLACGCLALKPQFGLVLGLALLASAQWRVIAGALLSVAAQCGAVALFLGASTLYDFAAWVPTVMANADLLEAKPYHSHSLRTLLTLLPAQGAAITWAVACLAIAWQCVRVWKSTSPMTTRLAIVMIGTVLVTPHLMIYDLTVLALPLLWLSADMSAASEPSRQRWAVLLYVLFATWIAPTAPLIGVQLSVVALVYLFFVEVARHRHVTPRPASAPLDADPMLSGAGR